MLQVGTSPRVQVPPGDPDAVWSMFDHVGYDLQIEDVGRCCRARLA
ncbi:MAG TPA: hypothetical protein VKU19_33670 [Bryobacteraceae bacterium]|nr:hypothetical protein [Bryobacteraceae bacterium]